MVNLAMEPRLNHFNHACLAAGARVSPNAQNAPNCVYFALGEYIGASDVAAQINRALVGSIRTTASGRREPVDSFLWPEVLSDLGFQKAEYPIVGDLIVYTILGGADLSDELAVHFGRVVAADEHQQDGIMVESKSGYAFDVYVHPIMSSIRPTSYDRRACVSTPSARCGDRCQGSVSWRWQRVMRSAIVESLRNQTLQRKPRSTQTQIPR